MKILVIDVGGTNLKVSIGPRRKATKIPSGPDMTAAQAAAAVKEAVAGRTYDRVSIGYPGPVVDGRPSLEPKNLGGGWVRFDYRGAFGKPVRIGLPCGARGGISRSCLIRMSPECLPRLPRSMPCCEPSSPRCRKLLMQE